MDGSGRSAQKFVMDVIVRRGEATRRAIARGRDIYAITAPLVVEALERIFSSRKKVSGTVAPGEIFDARDFLKALTANHLEVDFFVIHVAGAEHPKIAKDSDSGLPASHDLLISRGARVAEEKVMADKTCAACDCKLEGDPIKVKIGGKTVEVCCDDCAQKLKEADASTEGGEVELWNKRGGSHDS